ncbi:uncharacterized protein LOC143572269 [Bidens hawaiensis]|uniref:uncharacterized protein LOC143572269 n=1 Tax=Bidens hawaiensis TaxID=980011 RepID=UPI00404B6C85
MAYLSSGILPEEKAAARKIRHEALNYQIQEGVLYRRSFLGPLLRCVDTEDANYLIREVHEGICGVHAGPRMVIAKLMNAGYYWPGMPLDAVQEIKNFDSCQRHAPNTLRPKNELVPVTSAWPFQKWAVDIMFADNGLQEWLKELHVTQIFTSVAHPQANGQVERTNRTIEEGIKTSLASL